MSVSENSGTPKSSILIGFSLIDYVIPKTRKLKMNMFGQNGTHVKRTYERTCAQVNTQVNERVNVHVILR